VTRKKKKKIHPVNLTIYNLKGTREGRWKWVWAHHGKNSGKNNPNAKKTISSQTRTTEKRKGIYVGGAKGETDLEHEFGPTATYQWH